jgi:predicted regulator of Ras-like GTPase activity (Roadblock/LC7/MglB family)
VYDVVILAIPAFFCSIVAKNTYFCRAILLVLVDNLLIAPEINLETVSDVLVALCYALFLSSSRTTRRSISSKECRLM